MPRHWLLVAPFTARKINRHGAVGLSDEKAVPSSVLQVKLSSGGFPDVVTEYHTSIQTPSVVKTSLIEKKAQSKKTCTVSRNAQFLTSSRAVYATRSLVAVKPRRPPKTNVDTETAFRHDHCKTRVHIQKVNMSEVS